MGARSRAALFALLAAAGQNPPVPAATIVVAYRAASEDESSSGRMTLTLRTNDVKRAVVWERDCLLGASADAGAPAADTDQFWSIQADLAKSAAGPVARIRYRLVKPPAAGPQQEHLLRLDGRNPLHVEALSARTDCRYDRIHLTISVR